jgi:hypothetical protein
MKIRVYTRSLNDELYAKMVSLLPDVDLYPIKGENGYNEALTYLIKLLDSAVAYNYKFADITNTKQPTGITSNFKHDTGFEPFDGLFYFLHDKGNPLNLSAITHEDNISTGLIYNKLFCWHSWYSREYNGGHKKRINDLFRLSQQAHNKG